MSISSYIYIDTYLYTHIDRFYNGYLVGPAYTSTRSILRDFPKDTRRLYRRSRLAPPRPCRRDSLAGHSQEPWTSVKWRKHEKTTKNTKFEGKGTFWYILNRNNNKIAIEPPFNMMQHHSTSHECYVDVPLLLHHCSPGKRLEQLQFMDQLSEEMVALHVHAHDASDALASRIDQNDPKSAGFPRVSEGGFHGEIWWKPWVFPVSTVDGSEILHQLVTIE